jgi:hypothetical protein
MKSMELRGACWFWAVMFIWLWTAQGAAQQIKYVPSSATMAIQLRPKAALAQPAMAMAPRELLEVFGRKELGLNLLELERILIVVGKIDSLSSPEPPDFALVAEFSAAQALGGRLASQIPDASAAGGKVWQLDPATQLRQVTPQTFALGISDFLDEVLLEQHQPGVIGQSLMAAGEAEHLTLVVDWKALRPALEEVLPPEDQVPPPFRGFLDVPELVSQLSLRHSWSENGLSELRLETASDEDADRLERLMRAAINNAQQLALPLLLNELQWEDEDYQQALLAFGERVAGELKSGVEASRAGNAFVIDLRQNSQMMSVSVIGTLTGLLLPAVQAAREAARRTQASNNLRQLMIGMLNYESAYQHFPLQAIAGADGKKLLSWRVALLPFMEELDLYQQFHLDEPWDSEHNLKLLEQMPDVYRSPNVTLEGKTLYLAVTGPGTAFESGKKRRLRDVTDGLSNTIGLVEVAPSAAVPWTKPEDFTYEEGADLSGLQGVRPGGFLVAFLDGSTRLIAKTVDLDVLRKLFLINDGEVLGDLDRNP